MENLETIVRVFLIVNTLFVFRQRLWKKSISTPIIILASDIAYALYTYQLYASAVGMWGLAITGLVAYSAFKEQEHFRTH